MGKIITYKNEGTKGVFSQIELNKKERVLISIAANEIKIFKLKFFGSIPGKTIWNYPDLFQFVDLLFKDGRESHPLDVLVDIAKDCASIEQLQNTLDKFISNIKK